MNKIKSIKAKKILDSKGDPTLEVELETELVKVLASVPSGLSQGKYEAVELRDEDGKGVSKAIKKVKEVIEPVLKNKELANQEIIDEILIKLDATKNKSHLGANTILAVSMAACRANALAQKIPLYQHLKNIYQELLPVNLRESNFSLSLPQPSFNMLEGGKHSKSDLAFQEFMIIPTGKSFKQNLEIGIKIYQSLKNVLEKKFGEKNIILSKEAAFFCPVSQKRGEERILESLALILEAAEKTNLRNIIKFAIDVAASEFYYPSCLPRPSSSSCHFCPSYHSCSDKEGYYKFGEKIISKQKLLEIYQDLTKKYPIVSIEDPFSEEDFDGFREIKNKIGDKIIIFGDDLTVSNIERIKLAQEKNSCNGLILKPNQIGTVTETLQAAKLAKVFGWKIMVSHRAGETKDDFIADLAVGIGAEFIKSGAPFTKERMSKYNRLVKIEEEIKKD